MDSSIQLLEFMNGVAFDGLKRSEEEATSVSSPQHNETADDLNYRDLYRFDLAFPQATGLYNEVRLASLEHHDENVQENEGDGALRKMRDEIDMTMKLHAESIQISKVDATENEESGAARDENSHGCEARTTPSSDRSKPDLSDPAQRVCLLAESKHGPGRPGLRVSAVAPPRSSMRDLATILGGLHRLMLGWLSRESSDSSYERHNNDEDGEVEQKRVETHTEALYRILATRPDCDLEHSALLQLSRIADEDVDEELVFHMFLSHCSVAQHERGMCGWHKTTCIFDAQEPNTNTEDMCTCSEVRLYKENGASLPLSFSHNKLWRSIRSLTSTFIDQEWDRVTINDLLQSSRMKVETSEDSLRNYRLALRLGLSLHDLILGPWIWEALTADCIHVVHSSGTNPADNLDETYIRCALVEDWETSNALLGTLGSGGENCRKFFLSLAQLLVDIGKGERGYRPLEGDDQVRRWHYMLLNEARESFKDECMQGYREAIKGCLFFHLNYRTEAQRTPDPKLRTRKVIEDAIILPLRRNLNLWDRQPSLRDDESDCHSRDRSQTISASENVTEFTLWGTEEENTLAYEPKDDDPKNYSNHISTFLDSYIRCLPQPPGGDEASKRVRVAVVDTGFYLDPNDPVLRAATGRIKEKKNFVSPDDDPNGKPNETDWKDRHSHGTHVTRLLLRYAPRADIYVAKIANSGRFTTTRKDQLKKALEWAGKRADIINLSFGLWHPPTDARDLELERTIDSLATQGKLIFAAASNTGPLGSPSWPGAHGNGVFCIFAADQRGIGVRDLNPPRLDQLKEMGQIRYFTTLGTDIESFWDGKPCLIRGTSFATPMAAAMAANALEYARCKLTETWDRPDYFLQFSGMFKLFSNGMCHDVDGYDILKPWNLWKNGKNAENEQQNICDTLRKIQALVT